MILYIDDLKKIQGGSKIVVSNVVLFMGGFFAFLTGVFDGYTNPKKCNNI